MCVYVMLYSRLCVYINYNSIAITVLIPKPWGPRGTKRLDNTCIYKLQSHQLHSSPLLSEYKKFYVSANFRLVTRMVSWCHREIGLSSMITHRQNLTGGECTNSNQKIYE